MANVIRLKRGLKSTIGTLAAGEVVWCTDTNEIAVGDGATNHYYPAGGSSGGVEETDWTNYGDSATIIGWSSFTVKEIYYRKIGSIVFVSYHISGASNSGNTSFTVPYDRASGRTYDEIAYGRDGGASVLTPDNATIYLYQGTNIVYCYTSQGMGTWATSSTKTVSGTFWYPAAAS
jgi:hypothetical protein